MPGKELKGVISYRDIADTNAMIDAAQNYKKAVVIGGGLLGLEAANGLMVRGMDVTVVHVNPWLMERQLDDTAGKLLQKSLEARGIRFEIGAHTEALIPDKDGRVMAIRFKDGRELPADLLVMAVGIRPNTILAESMGLHCNRGIVVNDTLQTTTDPRIYAVGECAAHRGIAYGLVAPLFEQGKVCATHLAQFGIGRYSGSTTSTKLKVTGIDLFSAGNFTGGEGCEEIVLNDPWGGVYKKLVIKDDKLVGACLYGDTVDGSWYFKLMREGRKVSDIRDKLMFGENNIGDVGHEGNTRAASMADTDEVCGCNGVNKGAICKAIKDKGLFTLDEVRKHTKASAESCGSCTGLVEQLLMFTAGGDYSKPPTKKAMCGCTDASHADVRAAIREQHLLTIDSVQRMLSWRTPNGCASCRPALNYYLLSSWPKEAVDDPQSRYINERSHANIQKDGTYSVIPRMWGGETTPDELRRIADAADKYKVRTVKVTGGQRLDLLGVKKEDLPAIWKDIGMPSGHAYAKALRTVKTCVGSEWCRFGTQNSTQMGKDLERALWRMYAPHKVKLAVSAAARATAPRAGIKDVGVIGVDSGWELYVAGNGGIKTEVAQFSGEGEDAGRRARVQRCVLAAVSRRRLVPRTHGALRLACRVGPREEENPRRRRGPQGAVGEAAIQPRRVNPIRGSSSRRRRSTCVNSTRRWPSHERLESDLPCRRHSGARRAGGVVRDGAVDGRGVPQLGRQGLRAARPLPAQGRAAVARHRLRRERGLPAAQLDDRSRRRLRQRRRKSAARRRSRARWMAVRCSSMPRNCFSKADRDAKPHERDPQSTCPVLRRGLRRDHRVTGRADHRRARRP